MAIISTIGRKSFKVKVLLFTIYAGLLLGALTMLYPFTLMIAGSTKSAVDTPDAHVIPPYLNNREALYQKYVEALFNENYDMMKVAYRTDAPSFQSLSEPEGTNAKLADAWAAFCKQADLPFYAYMIGEIQAPRSRGVLPHRLRLFKRQLVKQFNGDISRCNDEMGADFVSWNAFYYLPEEYLLRRNKPTMRPLDDAFRTFKAGQPLALRYYFSPEGFYKAMFLKMKYGKEIDGFNETHGTAYTSWDEVHLDRRYPTGAGRTDTEREDWEAFVRTIVNLFWVRADAAAAPAYRRFLQTKYGTIPSLNKNYGTTYVSFDDVRLIEECPTDGLAGSDWAAFVEGWRDPGTGDMHRVPIEHIRIDSVDFLYRDHLAQTYGDLARLNATLGTAYSDWLAILPPQQQLHYRHFLKRTSQLKREFTTRNFITVVDYVILHGRGIVNTVIYCTLAVLAALIVNPLAAYALSRYKPPSQYKVLLFLMLTMAFPPMVTQIPAFLMLRELRLLNSFWALILPGLANGYSIFLLKGFFDSLPQELYESASIDGAGEFRIFWQITMSLSKPILAVIALNAFTMAYANFMMALLICQDESMWTLMPWLYQLQQRSGEGVVYASLLIAAVPTFIIFALCQNVIMRGIVVPVEK
ncbi:MAG: ABC transporter permease subunit [Lentisphaerae bacterium]|jgi:ABC-type glycerol-3-phosphate transport system permease component|nr:ABC transporter permease subunit [Lentisphaerota bacterium]MBT4818130.1 ABC transporter permease subunit [Lentisphaerota bacterium]MBT5612968.1 ABC transporter permease subunit [Lentisphaerota bacterium]MBT7059046.1 ABC transporter permease subunit [Lentisphaerota bacterium]MBT7846433.1 ABC transporter permease subunit [Lentisphaerota bacterium]